MKLHIVSCFFACMLVFPHCVEASEAALDKEILAKRGKGVVTQNAFAARASKIPVEARYGTLRSGGRVQDLIGDLLLRSQLAADAREAGFDTDQVIIDRMKLAAETELAEAWVKHYVESQPEGDYQQLALEEYQLNRESMLSPVMIDVSHILISTKERPEDEARELADSLSQQLQQEPDLFDQLVKRYSEDPSKLENDGKFSSVKKGDMVKSFEKMAFGLSEGEISVPVKTLYGYHIIRLDAHIAARILSFEEVKPQLVTQMQEQHQERVKRRYLSALTALEVDLTEEALEEMIDRQFGNDLIDIPEAAVEKE